jgi:hypothetical protein
VKNFSEISKSGLPGLWRDLSEIRGRFNGDDELENQPEHRGAFKMDRIAFGCRNLKAFNCRNLKTFEMTDYQAGTEPYDRPTKMVNLRVCP